MPFGLGHKCVFVSHWRPTDLGTIVHNVQKKCSNTSAAKSQRESESPQLHNASKLHNDSEDWVQAHPGGTWPAAGPGSSRIILDFQIVAKTQQRRQRAAEESREGRNCCHSAMGSPAGGSPTEPQSCGGRICGRIIPIARSAGLALCKGLHVQAYFEDRGWTIACNDRSSSHATSPQDLDVLENNILDAYT